MRCTDGCDDGMVEFEFMTPEIAHLFDAFGRPNGQFFAENYALARQIDTIYLAIYELDELGKRLPGR